MRVLLIQPELDQPEHFCPPLGIGYLAAVLLRQGHDVSIIDMDVEGLSTADIMPRVAELAPHIVGITSTAANAAAARRLGAALEYDVLVVHGGPEPTVATEDYLYANPRSVVLRGEAEHSLSQLVALVAARGPLDDVAGLSYRTAAGVHHGGVAPIETDLNRLSQPARHLYRMNLYQAAIDGEPATSIMGSRSCPYRCLFCHDGASRGLYRRRGPKEVVAELESIVREFGIRAFYFYDCTLTVESAWVEALCAEMEARRLDIIWQGMSRAGSLPLATLQKMRRAGCVRIAVGVESGSERSLRLMAKGIKRAQIERFFTNLKAAGILTRMYLILGFPWETEDDFRETLSLAQRLAPDEVAVSFATPFRGTRLFQMVKDQYPMEVFHDYRVMRQPAYIAPGFTAEVLTRYKQEILRTCGCGDG